MTRSPADAVRGLWEVLDRRAYDALPAWVTDDCIYLDAPLGRVDDGLLEPLADLVGLPDVGLEQDLPLGALDRGQHVVVQVLAEGVGRDRAVADRDLGGLPRRERLGLLAAATVGVDQSHRGCERHLDAEDGEHRAPEDRQHPLGGRRGPGHAPNLAIGPGELGRRGPVGAAVTAVGAVPLECGGGGEGGRERLERGPGGRSLDPVGPRKSSAGLAGDTGIGHGTDHGLGDRRRPGRPARPTAVLFAE